jgi:hypothetical protein
VAKRIAILAAVALTFAAALLAENIDQGTSKPVTFFVSDANGFPMTGLAVKPYLSKNGGAFAISAGTPFEIGKGYYRLDGNVTDTDTLGSLIIDANYPATYTTQNVYWVCVDRDANFAGLAALIATNGTAIAGVATKAATTEANEIAVILTRSTLTQAQVTGGAYALATNASGQITVGSLAPVTAWTVDITGSLSGSVGSVTAGVKIADGNSYAAWLRALAMLDANTASRLATSGYVAIGSPMQAGNVTVGGYAAGQDPATLVWAAATRTLTATAQDPDANWVKTYLQPGGIADANDTRSAANIAAVGGTITVMVDPNVVLDANALAKKLFGTGPYPRDPNSDTVCYYGDPNIPMQGVEVKITTDVSGKSMYTGVQTTTSQGKVAQPFMLNAGTYYVWFRKDGITFTNPKTITVTAP